MPRIFVTPPMFIDAPGPFRDVLDRAGFEIVHPPRDADLNRPEVLIEQLRGIDGVLASMEPYTREVLRASRLRAIARVGVGYDAIDIPAATEAGVVVTITPGTNENSVAEQAFALLLAVFREVACRDAEIRRGGWRRNPVRRLAGNTLGLVGLGRIGKAMVGRAHGLGLRVVAYDPYADRDFAARHGVELCSWDELLARADVVSLHMPCTAETTNLINRDSLARMKPGAVLINTSRGGLVDEDALADALQSGRLFGAGLDVLKVEPPPADHPLLRLSNVVLAPHLGGIDQTALDAMGQLAAECLVNLHRGACREECIVNRQLFPGWKW